jgi:hypothetical protein
VLAFEMSLGIGGYAFRFLYEHLSAYRGLRASARLGLFVLMFLAILAAYGYESIVRGWGPRARVIAVGVLAIGMMLEYHVTLPVTPYPNTVPPLYRTLRNQPRGVVVEFPIPTADELPGPDAAYTYASIFHWFPLGNGYSGMYPPSYLQRLDRLRRFPDDRSLGQLTKDSVKYVIVHEGRYNGRDLPGVLEGIDRSGRFTELGSFLDSDDLTATRSRGILYRFR